MGLCNFVAVNQRITVGMKWIEKYTNTIVETVSLLFVVLFIYAATSKVMDFHGFKVQLGQSPILEEHVVWVAWLVPVVEYALALLLLVEGFRTMALYGSFALMVMFTTYITLLLNFSDHIPCSCGGVLESLGWKEHLIFNMFFVLAALFSILLSTDRPKKIRFK